VLGQKPDDLASGFEKKAHNRANQPGQREPSFAATSLRPFPKALAVAFKPLVRTPMTALIVVPAVRRIAVKFTPYF